MKYFIYATIASALLTGPAFAESAKAKEAQFKRIDADADGKVTATEHADFFTRFFTRSDKNGDGVLEWKELAVSAFDKIDKNKDKKIQPAEHEAFRAGHFKALDQNKDGHLTLEEYSRKLQ